MFDLLDITDKVVAVTVTAAGMITSVPAYTDGQRFFFGDAAIASIGAHLTGRLDLAGRPVRVERTAQGWHEQRGSTTRMLHQRLIAGEPVYRFDDEWLFTPVSSPYQRRN